MAAGERGWGWGRVFAVCSDRNTCVSVHDVGEGIVWSQQHSAALQRRKERRKKGSGRTQRAKLSSLLRSLYSIYCKPPCRLNTAFYRRLKLNLDGEISSRLAGFMSSPRNSHFKWRPCPPVRRSDRFFFFSAYMHLASGQRREWLVINLSLL